MKKSKLYLIYPIDELNIDTWKKQFMASEGNESNYLIIFAVIPVLLVVTFSAFFTLQSNEFN